MSSFYTKGRRILGVINKDFLLLNQRNKNKLENNNFQGIDVVRNDKNQTKTKE